MYDSFSKNTYMHFLLVYKCSYTLFFCSKFISSLHKCKGNSLLQWRRNLEIRALLKFNLSWASQRRITLFWALSENMTMYQSPNSESNVLYNRSHFIKLYKHFVFYSGVCLSKLWTLSLLCYRSIWIDLWLDIQLLHGACYMNYFHNLFLFC